ncbi:Maf-like protein [Deltaproteobacteria bacterium]|nr:Maf-like protein [Deltaproteobacteria bacterium]
MSLFLCRIPLILASSSPRRIALLGELGLPFTVCPAPDEVDPFPGEAAGDYALRAAEAKAACVRKLRAAETGGARAAILAADTVVSVDKDIFGKPDSPREALAMLKRLNGRSHDVITACCLLRPDGSSKRYAKDSFAVTSRVEFWDCPEPLLIAYARGEEPLDKAGAYAAQGVGAFLTRSLSGSWSNVVGLPMSEVVERLLSRNIIAVA